MIFTGPVITGLITRHYETHPVNSITFLNGSDIKYYILGAFYKFSALPVLSVE